MFRFIFIKYLVSTGFANFKVIQDDDTIYLYGIDKNSEREIGNISKESHYYKAAKSVIGNYGKVTFSLNNGYIVNAIAKFNGQNIPIEI